MHYPLDDEGQPQFQDFYKGLSAQEVYNKYDWSISLQNNPILYYHFGVRPDKKDYMEGYFN